MIVRIITASPFCFAVRHSLTTNESDCGLRKKAWKCASTLILAPPFWTLVFEEFSIEKSAGGGKITSHGMFRIGVTARFEDLSRDQLLLSQSIQLNLVFVSFD